MSMFFTEQPLKKREEDPRSAEEKLRDYDKEDAVAYQDLSRLNYELASRSVALGGNPSGLRRLASAQAAYARWLMGIDDYFLSVPLRTRPATRPHRQP